MIEFNNAEHGVQIARAANSLYSPITHQVISRSEGGELVGGVLFENYTGPGGSIAIHSAAFRPNWVNRDLLWVTFDYPFNQLGVTRMFGQVHENNEAALRFNKNLGFEELHRLEGVFPDGDMVLMRMLRQDCRFLGMKPRGFSLNMEKADG